MWTKLFSWILQDRRKQGETFGLSSEFLQILLLDLPPSAEQVQALSAVGGDVEVRHEAVCARRAHDGEGVVEVVKTDAGAVQRDVGVDLLADLAEAEVTVNGKSSGVVCKDDVGAVPLFEPLLVRPTVHAACGQHPFAQQEMGVQPIQGPQQVLAGRGGGLARQQGAEEDSGTQEEHVSVRNGCRTHSSVANCCMTTKNARLVL